MLPCATPNESTLPHEHNLKITRAGDADEKFALIANTANHYFYSAARRIWAATWIGRASTVTVAIDRCGQSPSQKADEFGLPAGPCFAEQFLELCSQGLAA